HIRRAGRGRGDDININGGRVGQEQGARLHRAVELREHRLFHVNFLEYGLDDDIAVRDVGIVLHTPDQGEPARGIIFRKTASAYAPRILIGYAAKPALQGVACAFENEYRYAGIGEANGDAAAHRASAD